MGSLNILVVGPQFPDSFAYNIAVTLASMGHSVDTVETGRYLHMRSRWINALWRSAEQALPSLQALQYRRVVRAVESATYHVVLFTYGVPPELIDSVRKVTSAKLVCWFPDHIANYYRGYLIADSFDTLFLKEPFIVSHLRDHLQLNVHYLPEACNPTWHRPTSLTPEDEATYRCEIAAIGTLHYYRARVLEPLVGYDLKIWGSNNPPWLHSPVKQKYQNRSVFESDKAKACAGAKIVVNTVYYTEVDGVNNSMFEIAGCGGFQIATSKPAMAELFEPESEIVTFASRKELIEKVQHYLARPEERQVIARRAQLRAHREHTYEHRLNKLLDIALPERNGSSLQTASDNPDQQSKLR